MARQSEDNNEPKPRITKSGLKRLLGVFRFLLPYKSKLIPGAIALVLGIGTLMAFPYFAGKLVDVASGKPDPWFTSIHQVAGVLFGILAIQSFFSFVRVYTFTYVSEHSLADLRSAVYGRLIWMPMSFYDKRRIGELLSRITSDISTLYDVFTTTIAELLRQLLMLIGGIAIIAFIAPRLTLFMLFTFPILVLGALFFGKYIRRISREVQDRLAIVNVMAEETLQSIAVVKNFTNEKYEVARYTEALGRVVSTGVRTGRFRGLFISFTIVSLFGGIVGVIWYGGYLVQTHVMEVGELISFVLYTIFIGGSVAGLADIVSQVQRSIGASERILEILGETDERDENQDSATIQSRITYDNVSFSYPTRPDIEVLKGLSLEINTGEKVALVGASGAGKSTIASLLSRFYKPTSGRILIDGKDIQSFPLSAYRHLLGVVPQEVLLFGGTIRENISYGKPGASDSEIRDAASRAYALDFIESFPEKFDTLVGDRGVKLSGGQRQRIAIARAILRNPAILILDEATSSLDTQSEKAVQMALQELMKNRTTLIIAHRLSTIRHVDKIAVLKDGRVVESGTHDQLVTNPDSVYGALIKAQWDGPGVK